jgi:hypothetical protein
MGSRQGLRRFKLVCPSTAYHDCFSHRANYPRIVLDQRTEDENHKLRRAFLKEREIKKYKKIGVLRTDFHGIKNLPDSEFTAISDLVSAARTASALAKSEDINVDAFFEQLSGRLMKDADLVPINDLIAILHEFQKNNYLDLGLVNKIKNEIVYDISRVDLPELGIAIHTILGEWNIVSPKLIKAVLRRVKEFETVDPISLGLILRSLKNCPNELLKIMTLINKWENSLNKEVPYSEISSTLKILQYLSERRNIKVGSLEKALRLLFSSNVSDVESASEALSIAKWKSDIVTPEELNKLIKSIEAYASSVLETAAADDAESVEALESRNRAVNIASRIIYNSKLLGQKELMSMYLPAITAESVRGLTPKNLISLVDICGDVVIDELRRKKISLSRNDQEQIKQFL